MPEPYFIPGLPKDRFAVIYHIRGDEELARSRAEAVCVEQSVEFPPDLVPAGDISDHIVGRIEDIEPCGEDLFRVRISYLTETTGLELPQFLNVVFGNSSIQPGIRVAELELSPRLLAAFRGPRFGRAGLREYLQVKEKRPLLCTAIKPMGLTPKDLAELVYQCALGGIDMIKDDHGLADQSFSPFKERVERCSEAVRRANRETGLHCVYIPNITSPADRIVGNAEYAREVGAGGLMVTPALTGFDAMRLIADHDGIALPVICHPAFMGSFVTSPEEGIAHGVIFGQITRLAGADATIYPNYGGRFSFSKEECLSIVAGTALPMDHIKPSFPSPGGGMSLERIPEMGEVYDQDVIYLIGGNLHRGGDLVESSRRFAQAVKGTA
jgi:ribulose-bisphosphate carboxylase large chain